MMFYDRRKDVMYGLCSYWMLVNRIALLLKVGNLEIHCVHDNTYNNGIAIASNCISYFDTEFAYG